MAHDMLRRCYVCAIVLTFGSAHVESRGVELAFQFRGEVGSLFEPEPVWGHTVPILTPVAGRFVFDSSAPATYSTPGCDCTGYLQQYVNGLSADFGDLAVRADQYV